MSIVKRCVLRLYAIGDVLQRGAAYDTVQAKIVHLVPSLLWSLCLVDTYFHIGAIILYTKLQCERLHGDVVTATGAEHLVAEERLLVTSKDVLITYALVTVVRSMHVHGQAVVALRQCDDLAYLGALASRGIPHAKDMRTVGRHCLHRC